MRHFHKLRKPAGAKPATTGATGAPPPPLPSFTVGSGVSGTKGWSLTPAKPNGFQASDATLLSARLTEGNGKDGIKIMKGNISYMFSTETVQEWIDTELVTEEQQRMRWALVPEQDTGPGARPTILLVPQTWGAKNFPAALRNYGGNVEVMRADMMSKELIAVSANRPLFMSFYKGIPVLGHLKSWGGLFARIRVSNLHGSLWAAKLSYPERTVAEVDAVFVQEMVTGSIPVHLRLQWNPCLGQLGDAALRDLLRCADAAQIRYAEFKASGKVAKKDDSASFENSGDLGFPICLWLSDRYNVESIVALLGKYEGANPSTRHRSIIHKVGAFGDQFPDEFAYIKPKSDTQPVDQKKMSMKVHILRIEGLGEEGGPFEEDAVLDENLHSKACYHLVVNAYESDIAGSSGISDPNDWETFTRAYGPPPAVVWAIPQATVSVREPDNCDILKVQRPMRRAFESNGQRAANGIVHARVGQLWFAMGLFLKDNGVPVTCEWAATQLAEDRTPIDDKIDRYLCQGNRHGVACLTKWACEDDQLALNAGIAGPPRPDIQYRALVVRSEILRSTSSRGEKGSSVITPFSVEELTRMSKLTPAQGTACFRGEKDAPFNLSGPDFLVYTYALTPEVMSIELNPEQLSLLGGQAYDKVAPFPAPFASSFGSEDDAAMLALTDAAMSAAAASAPAPPPPTAMDVIHSDGGGCTALMEVDGEGNEEGEGEGEEDNEEGDDDLLPMLEESGGPTPAVGERRSRSRSKSPVPAAPAAATKGKPAPKKKGKH